MIIWFKGISGVGKSTLGKHFFKFKKKIKTLFILMVMLFGNSLIMILDILYMIEI